MRLALKRLIERLFRPNRRGRTRPLGWEDGLSLADRLITFKLQSGRSVWVRNFDFARTYAGMVEGVPSADLNSEIVAREVREARAAFPHLPVFLLPAEIRKTPVNDRSGRLLFEGVWMKPYRYRLCLQSRPIAPHMHMSELVIVWFDMPFHTRPIAAFLKETLGALDWDSQARDLQI